MAEMESGQVSFKSLVDNLWKTTQDVLRQVAVKEISKTESVRKEIEVQKTLAGKELLWKIFPIAIIGIIALWALAK